MLGVGEGATGTEEADRGGGVNWQFAMTSNNSEIQSDDFAFIYLDVDDPNIAWLTYRGIINSS